MIVREIKSNNEIEECVNMYLSLNDWLDTDFTAAYRKLYQLVKIKKFIRVVEDTEKIIAWIYCDIILPRHHSKVHFQQLYYASNQKGLKAYKCVVLLHQAMLEEAIRLGMPMALSLGSHEDEDNVFAKILEKNGWERRGYAAMRRL